MCHGFRVMVIKYTLIRRGQIRQKFWNWEYVNYFDLMFKVIFNCKLWY